MNPETSRIAGLTTIGIFAAGLILAILVMVGGLVDGVRRWWRGE